MPKHINIPSMKIYHAVYNVRVRNYEELKI